MATPAGDEISIKVRIDGTIATKDAEKVASNVKGVFVKGLAGVGSAALGFFFGGIQAQTVAAARGFGDMIGRGTSDGRNIAEFWGKVGAKQTAAAQTVEAFGLAGNQASKEQILSVYNLFKNIEEKRASSKAAVEGAIGEKEATETFKKAVDDFNFATKNFKLVVNEFMRGTSWFWK